MSTRHHKIPSDLVQPDLVGFGGASTSSISQPIISGPGVQPSGHADIRSSYIPNPVVIEQTPRGERQYDIYSRLLLDRIVFLGTEVSDVVANLLIAQFFFLEADDPEKEIHFYINSPGGSITAGLAIYDVMQFVKPEVYTFCMGMAASMGALLLTAGEKGKRFSLPHSRIMIHQPWGGARGQASDIEIQAREIIELKKKTRDIFVHHSGKSSEEISKDMERDKYFSAQEAVDYGLIDSVVKRHESVE